MMKSTPSAVWSASCSSKVCAHPVRGLRAPFLVHPGEADVAGHQALVGRDLPGQAHGLAVHRLELSLEADRRQLVPARVEGQRLKHLGAGFPELGVQLLHGLGTPQHHLGRERPRPYPAPLLQLEQVAAVAQHDPLTQSLENALLGQVQPPSVRHRIRTSP